MKKLLILFSILVFLFITVRLIQFQHDKSKHHKSIMAMLSSPAIKLSSFKFNPNSIIFSRIQPAPDFITEAISVRDNRKDYSSYLPSKQDLITIQQILDTLPPFIVNILNKHLVGMYFINGFQSLGMTGVCLDSAGNDYVYMVFNPIVLHKSISDLISLKESSIFINNDLSSEIRIEVSNDWAGFLYILLHESGHAADIIYNISPYYSKQLDDARNMPPWKDTWNPVQRNDHLLTQNIWNSYSAPLNKYDFPLRKNIHFYGLGAGPKIFISQATQLYKDLSKTCFMSSYATQNWLEDFSELFTFNYLSKTMGMKYNIEVLRDGVSIFNYDPMTNPLINMRITIMENQFQESNIPNYE